jgi:hypothetical protein
MDSICRLGAVFDSDTFVLDEDARSVSEAAATGGDAGNVGCSDAGGDDEEATALDAGLVAWMSANALREFL